MMDQTHKADQLMIQLMCEITPDESPAKVGWFLSVYYVYYELAAILALAYVTCHLLLCRLCYIR